MHVPLLLNLHIFQDLRIKVERLIQEKITASIVLSGYEKKMKSVHDQQNMEKNSLQMEINEANELTALSQREHKAKQKTANEVLGFLKYVDRHAVALVQI